MRQPRFTLRRMMVVVAILAVQFAALPIPAAVVIALLTLVGSQFEGRDRLRYILSVAGLGLFVGLLLPREKVAVWIGRKSVTLSFAVVDSVTRRPIKDARVRIIE